MPPLVQPNKATHGQETTKPPNQKGVNRATRREINCTTAQKGKLTLNDEEVSHALHTVGCEQNL
jgi:hypothetical protein